MQFERPSLVPTFRRNSICISSLSVPYSPIGKPPSKWQRTQGGGWHPSARLLSDSDNESKLTDDDNDGGMEKVERSVSIGVVVLRNHNTEFDHDIVKPVKSFVPPSCLLPERGSRRSSLTGVRFVDTAVVKCDAVEQSPSTKEIIKHARRSSISEVHFRANADTETSSKSKGKKASRRSSMSELKGVDNEPVVDQSLLTKKKKKNKASRRSSMSELQTIDSTAPKPSKSSKSKKSRRGSMSELNDVDSNVKLSKTLSPKKSNKVSRRSSMSALIKDIDDAVKQSKSLTSKKSKASRRSSMSELKDRTSIFDKKEMFLPTITTNYQKWEFGKKKTFIKPPVTLETTAAATVINKMVRGWWQRLQYRLKLVKYKLRTVDDRVKAEIRTIQLNAQVEIMKIRQETADISKRMDKKIRQAESTLKEMDTVALFLRKQNAKLREKNAKLVNSIIELRAHNERLELVSGKGEAVTEELKKYVEQIETVHAQITSVIPKYEESIENIQEAIDIRNSYYNCEKGIRIMYTKLLGNVVGMTQSRCIDSELIDEVVETVLGLEGNVPNPELPMNVECHETMVHEDITESTDGDSDDDQYTIASFDAEEHQFFKDNSPKRRSKRKPVVTTD